MDLEPIAEQILAGYRRFIESIWFIENILQATDLISTANVTLRHPDN